RRCWRAPSPDSRATIRPKRRVKSAGTGIMTAIDETMKRVLFRIVEQAPGLGVARAFLPGRRQTPTSPRRYDAPGAAIHHLLPVRSYSAIARRAGWRRHSPPPYWSTAPPHKPHHTVPPPA